MSIFSLFFLAHTLHPVNSSLYPPILPPSPSPMVQVPFIHFGRQISTLRRHSPRLLVLSVGKRDAATAHLGAQRALEEAHAALKEEMGVVVVKTSTIQQVRSDLKKNGNLRGVFYKINFYLDFFRRKTWESARRMFEMYLFCLATTRSPRRISLGCTLPPSSSSTA